MQALGSDDFDPLATLETDVKPQTPPILTKKQQIARDLEVQRTASKNLMTPSKKNTGPFASPPPIVLPDSDKLPPSPIDNAMLPNKQHPPEPPIQHQQQQRNNLPKQQPAKQQPTEWEQIVSTAGELFPGEQVHMYLGNVILSSSIKLGGLQEVACVMTTYRLAFAPKLNYEEGNGIGESKGIVDDNFDSGTLQIPLGYISSVSSEGLALAETAEANDRSSYNNNHGSSKPASVMVECKDGRWLRIIPPTAGEVKRAEAALSTFAFPGKDNLEFLFAFECRKVGGFSPPAGGIFLPPYDAAKEFKRQGVFSTRKIDLINRSQTHVTKTSQSPWRLSDVNKDYRMCSSYPRKLVVPRQINDKEILQCASFRSEGRIPSLTWGAALHSGSIWRSSQPKVGLQGNQNSSDEKFLNLMAEAASNIYGGGQHMLNPDFVMSMSGSADFESNVNHNRALLKILDLRPKSSANGNRVTGHGFELNSAYPNSHLTFMNISNIHAMRDSLNKVTKECQGLNSSDLNFSSNIEDTKWLLYVKLTLQASWQAAFLAHYKKLPVLVHCSHGWDRTSQVCALSQLFLDPYYRTFTGFRTLVEKDWLSFGHPFQLRHAHGEGKGRNEDQMSPIFLQFLDCVWQLVNMFPEKFEFNSRYLLVMADHIYSCRFGTFLYNTEKERIGCQVHERTESIWVYLIKNKAALTNPFYRPRMFEREIDSAEKNCEEESGSIFLPRLGTILRGVSIWADFHLRFSPKVDRPKMPPYLKIALTDALSSSSKTKESDENDGDGKKKDNDDSINTNNSATASSIDCDIAKLICVADTTEAWYAVSESAISKLKNELEEEKNKNKRKSALGAIDAKVFLDPGEGDEENENEDENENENEDEDEDEDENENENVEKGGEVIEEGHI